MRRAARFFPLLVPAGKKKRERDMGKNSDLLMNKEIFGGIR